MWQDNLWCCLYQDREKEQYFLSPICQFLGKKKKAKTLISGDMFFGFNKHKNIFELLYFLGILLKKTLPCFVWMIRPSKELSWPRLVWLSWLGVILCTAGLVVPFWDRAHTQVLGSVPTLMFLSLSLPFFLPKNLKKKIFRKKGIKLVWPWIWAWEWKWEGGEKDNNYKKIKSFCMFYVNKVN